MTTDPTRPVVRAIDALTTQVRRIADATSRAADARQSDFALTPDAQTTANDDTQRTARRQSLRVLLNRLNNGVPLTSAEAQLLTDHVAAVICDANAERAEADRLTTERDDLLADLNRWRKRARAAEQEAATIRSWRTRAEEAEATVERVRVLAERWRYTSDLKEGPRCELLGSLDPFSHTARQRTGRAGGLDVPSPPVTTPNDTRCAAHVYHVNAGGATIRCNLTTSHHGNHQSGNVKWPEHVAIYPIPADDQPKEH